MTSRLFRGERLREFPTISTEKLMYLGGLAGMMPTFRGRSNGLRLADAAEALQTEPTAPNFEADADFVERELFVPEDRGAI